MPHEITPNEVIKDPATRRRIGVTLYLLLMLTGACSLVLAFFPELNFGDDVVGRIVLLSTTLITWIASGFGLVVTTPNVPRA